MIAALLAMLATGCAEQGIEVGTRESALSGITLNGITLNGAGNNGVTLSGIGLDRVTLNGIALDGIYINQLGHNGVDIAGLGSNLVAAGREDLFGATINGLGLVKGTLDGIGVDERGVEGIGLELGVNGLYLGRATTRALLVDGALLTDVALSGVGQRPLAINGFAPGSIGIAIKSELANGFGALHLTGTSAAALGLLDYDLAPGWLYFARINGLGMDSHLEDSLVVDGHSLFESGLDGLHINGSGPRGLGIRVSYNQVAPLDAAQLDALDTVLFHLVGCALPADGKISVVAADGSTRTYRGARGFAPEWAEHPLSYEGTRRVHACLASSQGAYRSRLVGPAEADVLDTVLFHLVGCALPAGESISILGADGVEKTYQGVRGFAPEWADGPVSEAGERRVTACLASSEGVVSGLALNSDQADKLRDLLTYMAACALPEGEQVTLYDGDGAAVSLDGALGLAPEWATGPVSAIGEQKVSACLAARTNARGKHVRISLRGSNIATTAVERATYRHPEGAFWGNLFGTQPSINTCTVAGGGVSGRDCTGDDCGFTTLGACAQVCEGLDSNDGSYQSCAGEVAVISTYLALTDEVQSGVEHGCVVRDGALYCRGDNDFGQLGDGTFVSRGDAQPVTALGGDVVEVSGGARHTCARRGDGSAWCWGANDQGQLGVRVGSEGTPSPAHVLALGYDVASVAAGATHSCALTTAGEMYCWGEDSRGQVGSAAILNRAHRPVQVSELGDSVARIALGESARHTCAVGNEGTLHCWGANEAGQLGIGHDQDADTPALVVSAADGLALPEVTDVCTGRQHTCALTTRGEVLCWGSNEHGQLGVAGEASSTRPVSVALDAPVADVGLTCGADHTCAIMEDSTLRCWGANQAGQLGRDGTVDADTMGVSSVSVLDDVLRVSADADRTCAIRGDGSEWCWGYDPEGFFTGMVGGSSVPVDTL
ncbi:hypothetical protein [Haliangium sp.]|uniref:RCC1 domain-containing protein n=1 Tax=Haliangium sp. TaxID=2663208 RepID=UPI003D1285A3